MSSDESASTREKKLQQLFELVYKLTTSGQPRLDNQHMIALKKICRESDEYVSELYRIVVSQLQKDHAEIRLSASQIIDELFMRSHHFRTLLLADLQEFMELTMETDVRQPLPLPNSASKQLKRDSLAMIHRWFLKFGSVYKLLALGYNFLKTCKKINFANIEASGQVEQQRSEALRTRRNVQNEAKIRRAVDEMTDLASDIRLCLIESETCLSLLLPRPEEFFVNDNHHENDREKFGSDNLAKEPMSLDVATRNTSSVAPEAFATDQKQTCTSLSSSLSNTSDSHSRSSVAGGSLELQSSVVSQCENPGSIPDSTTHRSIENPAISNVHNEENHCITEADEDVDENDTSDEDDDNDDNNDHNGGTDSSESEKVNGSESDQAISESDSIDESLCRRQHGVIQSRSFTLSINLQTSLIIDVYETENNSDVIRTLLDQVSLIDNKFAPAIKRWLEVFTKTEAPQIHIRTALDLKSAIENLKKRINKLNIIADHQLHRQKATTTAAATASSKADSDIDEDDDAEFVEVGFKEWLAPEFSEQLKKANSSTSSKIRPSQCPVSSTVNKLEQSSRSLDVKTGGGGNGEDLRSKAPVIPFGTDLYHWGSDVEAPLIHRNVVGTHRWWTAHEQEDAVDVIAMAAINQRTIAFTGRFEPVKWKCRAPISTDGKVCQRMDRRKCPFHGLIIPRNELGQPTDHQATSLTASNNINSTQAEGSDSAWDDPELQADIFAATGIDLTRKTSRKRKSKEKKNKKETGLTNILTLHKNTARKRLESKILKKSTLKRVADSLDKIHANRIKDKFGNNFNYTFGPR